MSTYSYTTRYAPYVEDRHSALLTTIADIQTDIINDSPFTDYVDQDTDDAFFGLGYAIADFASLYDMFGKFMSGFDIEVVWSASFESYANMSEIDIAVKAKMEVLNDNMSASANLKFVSRNINAVATSSFIIGKANIEQKRTKLLSLISKEAKFNLLADIEDKFITVLNWKKEVIDSYAELMKLYYMTSMTAVTTDTTFAARNSLWPFTVLDFNRVTLGTMKYGVIYNKYGLESERKRSDLSKGLLVSSYVVSGAYIGYSFGGPYGAAIGAAVGFVIGVAQIMFE